MAINLKGLEALLDRANATASNEKEIRKSLARVESLVSNITKELISIYEILDSGVPAKKERAVRITKAAEEVNLEAPYGRRKDGMPKEKPGRSKTEGGTV